MGLREVQAFLQQPADVERVRLVPAGRHYVKFSGLHGGPVLAHGTGRAV